MAIVPRVSVRTRSEWGAKPATSKAGPLGRAVAIVVHHTAQGAVYSEAARADTTIAEGDRATQAVQASHFQRDFSDTGYHFLISGDGTLRQGREYVTPGSFGPSRTPPGLALGSHVKNRNGGRIGVNVIGCFGGKGERDCGDTPSEAAVETLVETLTALCLAYGVSPDKIVGHRDLAPNVCPGDRLYARLGQIRAAVAVAVRKAR